MEKYLKQLKEVVNKIAMEALATEYEESEEEKILNRITHIRTYEDLANNNLEDLFSLFKYNEKSIDSNIDNYKELISNLDNMSFKNVHQLAFYFVYLYSLSFGFPKVYKAIMDNDCTQLNEDEYSHYEFYKSLEQDSLVEDCENKKKICKLLSDNLSAFYSIPFMHFYCIKRERNASKLDLKLNAYYIDVLADNREVQSHIFQYIKNAKKKSLEEKENFNKKMIKITRGLKEFYFYLSNIKDNEPIKVDKLNIELLDTKDAQIILEYILQYNEQIFEKEVKEYTNYINDNYTVFKNIFKKYNFDFTQFTYAQQEYLINNFAMNDLFEILEEINDLFHKTTISIELLFYILKESDINDLQSISAMHINPEFLISNYSIFNKNVLNNVKNNIQLFKQKDIKWRREEDKNNSVILTNNIFLNYIIKLLDLYRKNMKDKELTNFDYLKNADYIINIERLIELGIEQKEINKIINNSSISVKHLSLLTKRLLIEKELGSNDYADDYWLEDELLDRFIINDVDNYVDDNVNNIINNNYEINMNTDNPYIINLDKEYKIDNYRYNINGIIISRYKVIRNINKLNKEVLSSNELLTTLTNNSILNTYEVELVKDSITKLFNTNILKR